MYREGQRGHRGGYGRGRGGGFWAAGLADQDRAALHEAIVATAVAARQVARDGGHDEAVRAAELLTGVRKELYRLLAGDASTAGQAARAAEAE